MFIAILCLNGVEQPFKRHQCPFFLPLRRGNPRLRRGSLRPRGGRPPQRPPPPLDPRLLVCQRLPMLLRLPGKHPAPHSRFYVSDFSHKRALSAKHSNQAARDKPSNICPNVSLSPQTTSLNTFVDWIHRWRFTVDHQALRPIKPSASDTPQHRFPVRFSDVVGLCGRKDCLSWTEAVATSCGTPSVRLGSTSWRQLNEMTELNRSVVGTATLNSMIFFQPVFTDDILHANFDERW